MGVIQQMAPGTDEGWEARTGFSPGGGGDDDASPYS